MANNPMVKFKFGEWSGFKGLNSWEAGTLYVTTDEQGLYFSKDGTKPVKLGNIITYNSLKDFDDNTEPPYNAEVFYYITDSNALIKYNGSKFVQLNKDYGADVATLKETVGGKDDTVATKETLWAYINKAQATADSASTAASNASGAASAAQGTADSALAKANDNAGNITTINGSIGTINGKISDLEGIVVNGDNSNSKLREAINANATAASTAQTKANDAYALAETADGKADTNASAIETINENIDTINDNLGVLEGAINEISESLGLGDVTGGESLSGRLKNVEDKADANATAISTIEENYATKTYAESEADAAEAAAKGYADTEIGEAKTELIGTEVTGNTSTIKGVKKYTDEQIATVNTSISTLEGKIGNLSNIMNFRGVAASFSEVSDPQNGDVVVINGVEWIYVGSNNDHDSTKDGWEPIGDVTATGERLTQIENAATALTTRVTALDGEGGKIATIESELSTANGNIAANNTAITTQTGRIDTLVNTTIPGIEGDIEAVETAVSNEETRAKGVEEGLATDIKTLKETTIPGLETAHNTLADRVTALDAATTGRVALTEADISTLNSKTGISSLTGNDTLYSLITAEAARADAEEKDIRDDFAAADAALETKFNNALTWGSF